MCRVVLDKTLKMFTFMGPMSVCRLVQICSGKAQNFPEPVSQNHIRYFANIVTLQRFCWKLSPRRWIWRILYQAIASHAQVGRQRFVIDHISSMIVGCVSRSEQRYMNVDCNHLGNYVSTRALLAQLVEYPQVTENHQRQHQFDFLWPGNNPNNGCRCFGILHEVNLSSFRSAVFALFCVFSPVYMENQNFWSKSDLSIYPRCQECELLIH